MCFFKIHFAHCHQCTSKTKKVVHPSPIFLVEKKTDGIHVQYSGIYLLIYHKHFSQMFLDFLVGGFNPIEKY